MIRFFDIVISCFGLFLFVPFSPIVLFFCWIETRSPLIFQKRIGKNLKIFTLIKFRTMYTNTKISSTHLVDDSSVTKIGNYLRKFKIDEIPQLINVLKGEMSLVGPRPCLPSQKQLINERNRRNVFSVLPGITGLSQINGIDMSNPELLAKSDEKMILYLKLSVYFMYILLTLIGRGLGDKVNYKKSGKK